MTLTHDFVNIGPGGSFADSGDVHTRPTDVDVLIDRIRRGRRDKVVLHFHGGLVSESAGMRVAERVLPVYAGADAHGIGIVWETGLVETVSRNLSTLNTTKLFNKLVNYAIRHAVKWLGADSGGRGAGTLMPMAEVEAARRNDDEIELVATRSRGAAPLATEDVDAVEPELTAELEADLLDDPEIESLVFDEQTGARSLVTVAAVVKLLVPVVLRVLRRFASKRDHGVIATVVEEVLRAAYLADLGRWMWNGMKSAAEAMWLPNTGPIGTDSHAGSHLLYRLAELQADRPAPTVDLIGHSAGAIAVCELIDTAARRHPDFRVRNVALLAPACTPEVFQRGILSHQGHISRVRVFGMHDELERKDRLVPGVYPSSLLYFVSGALEKDPDTPLVGLERHTSGRPPFGDDPRLIELHQFLHEAGRDRLVLSKTEHGLPDMCSASTSHGGFDDDPLTMRSLAAMIAATGYR